MHTHTRKEREEKKGKRRGEGEKDLVFIKGLSWHLIQ